MGEQDYQWRIWLNSIRPLSANVPLATTLGNHEMYTLEWKMREALCIFELLRSTA